MSCFTLHCYVANQDSNLGVKLRLFLGFNLLPLSFPSNFRTIVVNKTDKVPASKRLTFQPESINKQINR